MNAWKSVGQYTATTKATKAAPQACRRQSKRAATDDGAASLAVCRRLELRDMRFRRSVVRNEVKD